MAGVTTKDRILNAAEALACEVGAAALSLEAVASKAKVSKGGLLYHFPSKDALLQALLARRVELFDAAEGTIRARRPSDDPGNLHAFLRAGIEDLTENSRFCRGLVAAAISNPKLLKPVRAFLGKRLKELGRAAVGRDQAIMLWLAVEGLRFQEMFEVSPLSAGDRRRITRLLLELAERKFQ